MMTTAAIIPHVVPQLVAHAAKRPKSEMASSNSVRCICGTCNWLPRIRSLPQYTEIHRVQAQRQVQETLYMMGYREK